MSKKMRGQPKQKRRAASHWAGGQLFDDLTALQELVDEAVTDRIYSRVAAQIARSRDAAPHFGDNSGDDNSRIVLLRERLVTCVGWFRNARNYQRRPTNSEIAERLRSIHLSTDGLWRSLGLPGKPIQAANGEIGPHLLRLSPFLADLLHGVVDKWGRQCDVAGYEKFGASAGFSTDLARLEEALATQSDPASALVPESMYSAVKIFEVIASLQLLALWVKEAELRVANAPSSHSPHQADWPLYRTTWELAKVYAEVFSAEPTETAGGPWLTFLREVLALAGEGHRSAEALRQLWRKTRRVALASPR